MLLSIVIMPLYGLALRWVEMLACTDDSKRNTVKSLVLLVASTMVVRSKVKYKTQAVQHNAKTSMVEQTDAAGVLLNSCKSG